VVWGSGGKVSAAMRDPADLLEAMSREHPNTAPAWWPPDDLDALIEDWRTLTTEAFHERLYGTFVLCAALAFACRNARLIRRLTGRYR